MKMVGKITDVRNNIAHCSHVMADSSKIQQFNDVMENFAKVLDNEVKLRKEKLEKQSMNW
jgi:hypothetical protein